MRIPDNDEHLEAYENERRKENRELMHEYYNTLDKTHKDILFKLEAIHDEMVENGIPHLCYVDDGTHETELNLAKLYYPLKTKSATTSKNGLIQVFNFFRTVTLNLMYWAKQVKYAEMCVIEYPMTKVKNEFLASETFIEKYTELMGDGEDYNEPPEEEL